MGQAQISRKDDSEKMCDLKSIKVIFILVVSSIFLTGCYPNGEIDDGISLENSANSDGVIQTDTQDKLSAKYESEQFSVDLKLPEKVPEQAPKIKLKPRFWNGEKLREIFIGAEEITSGKTYVSNGFPDEKRFVIYFGDDNSRLIYEPMNINFECNDEISAVQSSIAGKLEANWYDQFSDEELQCFSSSDALSRVKKIIDALEITNTGEPVIRAVTAKKGNELMNGKTSADKDGNEYTLPKLNDEDEFYFITYPLVYNSIELSQHLKMNAEIKKSHYPSCVKAVVSKDKIVQFECSGIYEPEFKFVENILINHSANDALNVLIKHYTGTFQMNSTTLLNCKLVYITSDVFEGQCREFTPVWQFSGYEINESERKKGLSPERLHYDYILPQTGEIYEDLF